MFINTYAIGRFEGVADITCLVVSRTNHGEMFKSRQDPGEVVLLAERLPSARLTQHRATSQRQVSPYTMTSVERELPGGACDSAAVHDAIIDGFGRVFALDAVPCAPSSLAVAADVGEPATA